MNQNTDCRIHRIPMDQIIVLNPRQRGKKKFARIVENIEALGLKKPVTVARLAGSGDPQSYYLVCGQGRLEAYQRHGETEIPAFIIQGSKEDLLLMSLAENLARRRHSTLEMVQRIAEMKERGDSLAEIAEKTALALSYVRAILTLLAKGEEKLLRAVENGDIPVSIAITIATSDDKGTQLALAEAYERNDLRGKKFLQARRLVENRRLYGKSAKGGHRPKTPDSISADEVLKTYRKETLRQRQVVQQAKICETRLLFARAAVKQLLNDEHFATLLRAEGLDSLPHYLMEPIAAQETSA